MTLPAMLADLSVLTLGLRLIVSLGIVLGAIAALAWAARRRNGNGFGLGLGGGQNAIIVRSRESLTRTGTVALIEVGERALLVGITEQRIDLLAEGADLLPPKAEQMFTDDRTSSITDPDGSASPGMSFMEMLRERSVRRP